MLKLYHFGPYDLPVRLGISGNPPGGMDVGSGGDVVAPTLTLPGGYPYDPLGSQVAQRGVPKISATFQLTQPNIETNYLNWLGQVGRRDFLWRQNDINGSVNNVLARLLNVTTRRLAYHVPFVPVTLSWELLALPWNGLAHALPLAYTTNGVWLPIPNVANGGNATQRRVVLTVAPTAGKLSGFYFLNATTNQFLAWGGSIPNGNTLIIDCGAMSVLLGGVTNAYAGLARPTTTDSWFELAPGVNSISFQALGTSSGTATLSFSDGWQ